MSKHDRRTESETKPREKRTPIYARASNLDGYENLIPPGKTGRWVNDMGGRLQAFLDAGYVFVQREKRRTEEDREGNTDIGSRVSKIVDKTARLDSKPVRAYLMAIDKDLYEEDQTAKLEKIKEIDKQIHRGKYKVNTDGEFESKIEYSY